MSDELRQTAPLPEGPEAAVRTKHEPVAGIVAAAAGFLGLVLYRFLIGDDVLRYIVPALDAVAIALAGWLLIGPQRRRHWDYALAALFMAGLSLYFFVSYVTGSPAPGGT